LESGRDPVAQRQTTELAAPIQKNKRHPDGCRLFYRYKFDVQMIMGKKP